MADIKASAFEGVHVRSQLFRGSRLSLSALLVIGIPVSAALSLGGSATAATGAISGTVFRDFNQNGIKDPAERFIAGVWVKAFGQTAGADTVLNTTDDMRTTYGPVKTDAAGAWSILGVNADDKARVEFYGLDTNADSVFDESERALPAWLKSSAHGSNNGSSVQFVTPGTSSVSYAVANPADYCQANPELVISCATNGNAPLATDFSLYKMPFTSGTAAGLTVNSSIGSIYGVAYNRATKQTLASAYLKRHTAVGPQGLGGIYAVDAAGAVAWSVNTSTLGVAVGTIGTNTDRGLAGRTVPSTDATAFDAVGRVGLGDIDISEDNTTAWFTSLADNKLYSLALPTNGTAPTATAVGNSLGGSACDKPMAVAPHDGKIYVGVVCTTSLQADVVSFNPSTGTWTLEVPTFSLAYTKGSVFTAPATAVSNWKNWVTTYDAATMQSGPGGALEYVVAAYPQAMLADIGFDSDGSLVLGFRDRFGDQVGHRNNNPLGTYPAANGITGVSGGDILRVCNTATGLVLEGTAACPSNSVNAEGPGGGEFYSNDKFGTFHQETSNGGLVLLPGTGNLVLSSMDPAALDSGGVKRFNSITGADGATTEIYRDGGAGNPAGPIPASLGKANGLGDLEALCDQAPIEVGNRVWVDTDKNGQQDPGEAPLAGVVVKLFDSAANLIGTATTDALGQYWFSSAAGTSTASEIYAIAALTPITSFTVKIEPQTVLTGYTPTTRTTAALAGDPTAADSDSDGVTVAADVQVSFSTGTAGSNDHTIDFGFFQGYSLGNRVWIDTDDDSILDATEVGLNGATVELLTAAGASIDPDGTGPLTQTLITTANGGYYRFDQLAAGQYKVKVTAPTGYLSSTLDELSGDADVDAASGGVASDNGIGSANMATSGVITLGGVTPEPSGETDLFEGQGTLDNRANMTVDFGFHFSPPTTVGNYSIGNLVWLDANNNGVVDGSEAGIGSVPVRLYSASGALVASTTTIANGQYVFAGLGAGDYRVEITPPTGFKTSTGTNASATGTYEVAPDPDNDINNDDNGSNSGAVVTSALITLGGSEPTTDGVLTGLTDTTSNDRSNYTVDFGLFRAAALGDCVWYDLNRNGQQDADEPGVAGVTVQLLNSSGTVIATATTDANGCYLFDNLRPGAYRVQFVATTLPSGWSFTTPNSGDDATDSDADETGRTGTYELEAGDRNLTVDAGIISPKASLGDTVWYDTNSNGQQDAGETGVVGVKVNLLDGAGNVVATTTTNSNGKYLFGNLDPGTFSVEFVKTTLPTGFVFTIANSGSDSNDSDANTETGRTTTYALVAGQHQPTVDAGIVATPTVLIVPVTAPATTTPAPSTTVPAAPTTTPPTTVPAAPTTKATPATTPVVVPGQPTGMIGDTVFVDKNKNGKQDPGEPPIEGAIVNLTLPDGTVFEAATDENGRYKFNNLPAGSYVVEVQATKGPTNGPKRRTVVLTDAKTMDMDQDFGFASAADVRGRTIDASLAYTGGNTQVLVMTGLALLAAGIAITNVSRRRKMSTTSL